MSTKQERKETQPSTSASTPPRPSEREHRAGPGSLAAYMKAIVRHTYGSPDVLELRDIDQPQIAEVPEAIRYLEGGHARGKVVISL